MALPRPRGDTRTVLDIVRANTFTRFNALLGTLLVVILVIGPLQDAIFGLILVVNTAIGIVQELRVKLALDRLSVLTSAPARVRRDGRLVDVGAADLAAGDVIELRAGEQVLADGEMVESAGLEVNEALVTGEAQPIAKGAGAELVSGSFAVAGSGAYRAVRVAGERYADALVAQAKEFRGATSEIRNGINRMLAVIAVAMVPVGALLIRSQALANPRVTDAIRSTVAGLVTMVPEGLVLLTSMALGVAVLRLATRGTLVQDLPSVETLARADVVFVDKTGTITDGSETFAGIEMLRGETATVETVLATLAAGGTDDPDLAAIGAGVTATPLVAEGRVPFSAERRWSSATVPGLGEWRLGSPETVLGSAEEVGRAHRLALDGYRVLAVANGTRGAALVTLRERIRPDARATFEYLAAQGVSVKILSGDSVATVAGVARRAGLESGETVEAAGLDTGRRLIEGVRAASIIGRAGPEAKRNIVRAMREAGQVVAMVGDGVNDVLALKEADIGIAMQSASPACRGVAQIVVTRGGFSALPAVIGEGRRVIGNVERLASLFLTKTVYAFAIAFTAGILLDPFPFLSRHLTLISLFTIGIPAFFLTLERNDAKPAPGFVGRTLRFAVPSGLVAAAATYLAYELASEEVQLDVARTTAALVLAGVALWLLSILARPLTRRRQVLLGAMLVALVLTFTLPLTRAFFGLVPPPALVWLAGIGIVGLTGLVLEAAARASGFVQRVVRQGAGPGRVRPPA